MVILEIYIGNEHSAMVKTSENFSNTPKKVYHKNA